jgi:hypothetical protein
VSSRSTLAGQGRSRSGCALCGRPRPGAATSTSCDFASFGRGRVYAETHRQISTEHEGHALRPAAVSERRHRRAGINWLTPLGAPPDRFRREGMFEVDYLTQRLVLSAQSGTKCLWTARAKIAGREEGAAPGGAEAFVAAVREGDALQSALRKGSRRWRSPSNSSSRPRAGVQSFERGRHD